ncbi:fatty-acyl-CoA synthase [Sphingomonas sp. PP-F2F-A104-K0414]|nr:fatty-acyl-CoA synthase [Sphingomonas sp. PP-F2F-A104-K0414]
MIDCKSRGCNVSNLADVTAAAFAGLPQDLPNSSYELLRRSAETFEDRRAIGSFATVEFHKQTVDLSYRGLFAEVTKAANLFHRLNVSTKSVVAVLLPNLLETHVAIWGAEAAGIVLPLNPLLEVRTLIGLLDACGATVLVTFGGDRELIAKAQTVVAGAASIAHVALVAPDGTTPPWRSDVEVHDFVEARGAMLSEALDSGRVFDCDDVASLFCTGGTTGVPKIAVRTHGQVIANAWMSARMLTPAFDAHSVILGGLPLFHVNAVMVTGLVPFLIGASVLIATPLGFRAPGLVSNFWEIVAYHRITCFSAVPTLLAALLEHSSDEHDISSLRFAICGAAPLSAELLHRFERSCKVAISEGYGLTEVACVASVTPIDGVHKAGSVGLPLPLENLCAVMIDNDGTFLRFADVDEVGIIAIAGPHVFSGYLDAHHNRGVWIDDLSGQRWLNTGDLGRIDVDGYLWLTGRTKDLIIRGGHNIDPSAIEEALYSHPDVALASAIGRPDAYAGEIPVAYVQLRPGATADEASLADHIADRIGERAAIPKAIVILAAMPVTAVGKIHKPSLRLLELAAVTRSALDDAQIRYSAIEAVADDRTGACVQIWAAPSLAAGIRTALAPFTFPYKLL